MCNTMYILIIRYCGKSGIKIDLPLDRNILLFFVCFIPVTVCSYNIRLSLYVVGFYLWSMRDEDLGVVEVPASEPRNGHDDEREDLLWTSLLQ